jgi:hypothetical protein
MPVTANVVRSSPILVTVIMETIHSSETSVLTRATRRHSPEDGILQGNFCLSVSITASASTYRLYVSVPGDLDHSLSTHTVPQRTPTHFTHARTTVQYTPQTVRYIPVISTDATSVATSAASPSVCYTTKLRLLCPARYRLIQRGLYIKPSPTNSTHKYPILTCIFTK